MKLKKNYSLLVNKNKQQTNNLPRLLPQDGFVLSLSLTCDG